MSDSEMVTVKIMDKDFQINCPPGEKEALVDSAVNLDERMREMRKNGKVVGLDRLAVMAALNTTYELLQKEHKEANFTEVSEEKLSRLSNKIDDTLQFCKQLEI